MKANPWTIAGLGVAGWFVYSSLKNKASAAQSPATPGGSRSIPYTPESLDVLVPGVSFDVSPLDPSVLRSTLTAQPAVTGAQVGQASTFWNTLQPVAPIDTGYITFPSGSQVGASLMSSGLTRMDASGNYYVLWGGQVYLMGSQDSSGNWPTLLVSA